MWQMSTSSPTAAPPERASGITFRHFRSNQFVLTVTGEASRNFQVAPFVAMVTVDHNRRISFLPAEQIPQPMVERLRDELPVGFRLLAGTPTVTLLSAFGGRSGLPPGFQKVGAAEFDLVTFAGLDTTACAYRLALSEKVLQAAIYKGELDLAIRIAQVEFRRDLTAKELRSTARAATIYRKGPAAADIVYRVAQMTDIRPTASDLSELIEQLD